MSLKELIEQIKLIKDNHMNGITNGEEIVEELEDLIRSVEGNDGMDMPVESDDDFYMDFDEPDFTLLDI